MNKSNKNMAQGTHRNRSDDIFHEIVHYQQIIDSLRAEIYEYKKTLGLVSPQIAQYQQVITSVRAEIAEYQSRLANITSQNTQYQQIIDSLRAEIYEYKSKLDTVISEQAKYKDIDLPSKEIEYNNDSPSTLPYEDIEDEQTLQSLSVHIAKLKRNLDSII